MSTHIVTTEENERPPRRRVSRLARPVVSARRERSRRAPDRRYGGKLLLHNTRLFLKCGRRYGICGKNGVGKTTLMRNVDNGKIEGLDPDLVSVFVESHADEDADDAKSVVAWTTSRPALVTRGAAAEGPAVEVLRSVGFSDELLAAPVASLSGGWRMKLSLVVAALMDADILLLDEPTNHLDKKSIEWLVAYLTACRARGAARRSRDDLSPVLGEVAAAASPRLVPTDDPRRGRGVAATRLRGRSASRRRFGDV